MKRKILGIALAMVALVMIPKTVLAADISEQDAQIIAQNWTNIKSKVQNSEYITELKKDYSVSITGDATKFELVFSSDKLTAPYKVTYIQSGKIAQFVTSNANKNLELAKIDDKVNAAFLKAVAEIYGYDAAGVKEFQSWISKNANSGLTIEKDGVEFSTYSVEYKTNGQTSKITTLKTLSINILCKISGFEPSKDETPTPEVTPTPTPEVTPTPTPEVTPEPEVTPTPEPEQEKVENPQTGLYVSIGVLVALAIGVLGLVVSRKKTYFSKI